VVSQIRRLLRGCVAVRMIQLRRDSSGMEEE
jgi:hypothetical protein